MKLKEFFSDESKWCRGHYAKYVGNNPCNEVVSCCLVGAIYNCYEYPKQQEVRNWVLSRLGFYSTGEILIWNDEKATFKDIKKLVNDLDI